MRKASLALVVKYNLSAFHGVCQRHPQPPLTTQLRIPGLHLPYLGPTHSHPRKCTQKNFPVSVWRLHLSSGTEGWGGGGGNSHTECLASFVEFKVIPEFVSDLGFELASSLVKSIHRWWLSAKWEHSRLASCCFNLNTNRKLLKQRPPPLKT